MVGRVENTGDLVTADQIRDWCGDPFARWSSSRSSTSTSTSTSTSYEVPDRFAEQTAPPRRDCACSPGAPDPRGGCDADHVIAHADGGTTCSCNIAPLCRRHHRLKTHAVGWTYTVLDPGTYLWSSPHGYRFLRDHAGTQDITRDPPPRPD